MITNTVQLDLYGNIYYPHHCKYCGKGYYKKHNHQLYCTPQCARYARLEYKADYQRWRRKEIREGRLISNEYKHQIGTSFLSKNRRHNFRDEYEKIQKEMRRLHLR